MNTSRTDGRPYYVCVQNLPPETQYTHLKDFVRTHLGSTHQPGWAEVSKRDNGTVSGTTSLTTREEATRVFQAFTTHGFNGWTVLIHIWNTSSSPPTLIECNCPQIYGIPGHSDERVRSGSMAYMPAQPAVIPAPVPAIYASLPASAPVYGGTQMVYVPATAAPVMLNPMVASNVALASTPYYYPATANPIYSTGANGMPVDVTRGTVPTVARRVHFTNLDYSVREEDLRAAVQQYADPLNVDISRRQNGASQGWAIAEFASGAEAQLVVSRLNNMRLGSRVMKVKLDANRSVVMEPVIANGSMSRTGNIAYE